MHFLNTHFLHIFYIQINKALNSKTLITITINPTNNQHQQHEETNL